MRKECKLNIGGQKNKPVAFETMLRACFAFCGFNLFSLVRLTGAVALPSAPRSPKSRADRQERRTVRRVRSVRRSAGQSVTVLPAAAPWPPACLNIPLTSGQFPGIPHPFPKCGPVCRLPAYPSAGTVQNPYP